MKRLSTAIVAALVLATSPALAENNSTSGSYAGSQSGVTMNSKGGKSVGAAIAPGLASSGLSCMGSASAAAGGSTFSLSFGMTHKDDYCNAREDAKYIVSITRDGLAAKERLCDTSEIRKAFARAGHPCFADRGVQRVARSR